MDIDFNGETIEVDIPEGFVPTDCIVIIRSQSMDNPGEDGLSMGVTQHTGGILQHGMLSLVTTSEAYVGGGYDDE